MYNKIVLVGNLTRDIELRYFQNGTALAKSGIATNRKYKDANGEQKVETMFIDFNIFGRSAEIANQYLRKGSFVLLEGRLVQEQWIDSSGQKKSRHIVAVSTLKILDRKNGESQQQSPQNQSQQPVQKKPANKQSPQIPEADIDDDDIPF